MVSILEFVCVNAGEIDLINYRKISDEIPSCICRTRISDRLVDKLIRFRATSENVFVASSVNSVFTVFSLKFIFVIIAGNFIVEVISLAINCFAAYKF